jgi:hypothetical protein
VATSSSALILPIVIEVVMVLVILRRSYRMSRGVPYSGSRLVALPVLLLVLWGFTELESLPLTPWALPYLIALDAAILVVTSLLFARVAERFTQVYRDLSGRRTYRIGFSIAALFVGAFVARLALAVAFFPASLSFGAGPSGFPPPSQQVVLASIDAVFSLSVALLVGRSLGVHRGWKRPSAADRLGESGGLAPTLHGRIGAGPTALRSESGKLPARVGEGLANGLPLAVDRHERHVVSDRHRSPTAVLGKDGARGARRPVDGYDPSSVATGSSDRRAHATARNGAIGRSKRFPPAAANPRAAG